MVYTSLKSLEKDYSYDLNIAHLYGDLMNTYGDNGNILMLKYVAEKCGAKVQVDIVSMEDDFNPDFYDIGIQMINDYWLILEVTGLVLAASVIGALTMAKIEREN